MSTWLPAGTLADLADGTAVHVDLAELPICLARSRGCVYALYDECSHGQVALSDGEVADGLVECWQHGSRFDLSTGAPIELPATRPVPVYPVRITDEGTIEVAVPQSQGATSHR